MSDEALMKRYKQGDEEAFMGLYQKYSPMVWGYIRKRLREAEAEDFYQKVWRQLHEKRSLYQDSPFAPWFFVMIRNLLVDEYRKLGQMRELLSSESLSGRPVENEVEDILSELPKDTADLVRKYYLEGFSYEELAKETGVSEAGLRQRLSRALRGLRGYYEK